MTDPTEWSWPEGVKKIEVSDLNRLGIDQRDQLYWDGRRIEIRRRLDLTRLQKTAAILVTLFAVLGGLGGFFSGFSDAAGFLCTRGVHWLSCPLHAAPD